jgi:uncharacterized protein (TIGR02246 family)
MTTDAKALREMAARYAEAWSSHDPEAVASFYAEDGKIVINRGDPIVGRAAVAEMAQGFYDEFPDIVVHLDELRHSDRDAVFLWTLEGTHSGTGNRVKVGGWEAWELNDALEVAASRGYFDAEDYDRQVTGG